MMNEELETTFIVLQTLWDLFLICTASVAVSIAISYIATLVWTEEQIENWLNKSQ